MALEWDNEEDTVVPGHHSPDYASAWNWENEEDTVVPGHHSPDYAFSWQTLA